MSVTGGERHHRIAPRLAVVLQLIAGLVLLAASTGCYSVPAGQSAISTVTIEGAHDIDTDDLADHITTRESSRFLGIIYSHELFDRYALRRDLARIERYMHARGYYDAIVRVARVVPDDDKVRVSIEVFEGRLTTVESTAVAGDETVEASARLKLRSAIGGVLPKGAPLDEDKLADAEKAALKALTSRGHAGARVERHVEVDLATATARITFTVAPGAVARVGTITWKGLDELPEDKVRRVFAIKEGDLYSSDDVDQARQALLDLGVFASVGIALDTKDLETTHVVPMTVTCEVSKLRALLAGGGLEFDSLKTDVHLLVGLQSSNFLGGLRRLDVRFKPGVVLYPTRFPDIKAPNQLLPESQINLTLRQPAFIESRTTGLARADYNIYPVLLPGSTSQSVLGYHEIRGTVGVERTFFGHLYISPQYGAQGNFPFDYIGRTPDALTLVLSYLDVFAYLDFRDDPIHPRKGIYIANQVQVAGGPLQGDASDIRVQPEIRVYVPLTKKRFVLATRGSIGSLFPFDYGKYAEVNFRNPGPSRVEGSARDYQILFFRGFYAGGPVSNRGYPLRGIGPYDVIPYLSPAGQSISASGCNPNDKGCTLPTGGRTLWELSVEVRINVAGPFSTAVFCDAADVSPFTLDVRLDRPHLSCGAGARYDTPVGPIRLDVGYRIPGLQYLSSSSFERPPDTLFGAPIALAFGIGEAF
ncbi:MAG: outer membrane protein assembly factor YaeT precursor [Myxococcaceae bacterium]|nr:outer membrane protein assembly factor YaeT precursor [Myxococcaceae bacterium]MEA2749959.1 translocation and assembly module TamA [Myxococcales bacterium]